MEDPASIKGGGEVVECETECTFPTSSAVEDSVSVDIVATDEFVTECSPSTSCTIQGSPPVEDTILRCYPYVPHVDHNYLGPVLAVVTVSLKSLGHSAFIFAILLSC